MAKKVRASKGRSKAGELGGDKVKRRRVGPEEVRFDDPDQMAMWMAAKIEASAEAEATGELAVDVPVVVKQTSDGSEQRIRTPPGLHPAMTDLKRATRAFYDLALQHANQDAVVVCHILSAVCDAVEQGDSAALREPEKWARARIRPPRGSIGHFGFLPLEDPMGRSLSISQISGGFYMLAALLQAELERYRANTCTIEEVVSRVATLMVHNFPAIKSLSSDPDTFKRQAQVAERVRAALCAIGDLLARDTTESLGRTIAEQLLRDEFKHSGSSPAEIRAAFHFLDP
ncbi:hypothetical protein [Sorangium sp. So ce204]|uniref:hypothetical protein n=1 Tax=Sorangium sp. So ce204 TaxID=3133288 RepID=UPI003F61EFF3